MRRVAQDRFGVPAGNCYEACIASILSIDLADVPYVRTSAEDRHQAILRFLFSRSLLPVQGAIETCGGLRPPSKWGVYILNGTNPRGALHAVVAVGDEIVWDPNRRKYADGLVSVDSWEMLLLAEPFAGTLPIVAVPPFNEEDLSTPTDKGDPDASATTHEEDQGRT